MMLDRFGNEATPGATSTCPSCHSDIIAKCGTIVTWHWAHRHADCDPWAEPESEWHLGWKRHLRDFSGASLEVVMGAHRADAVKPNGTIIELQSNYLGADQIAEREAFYGPRLVWLYRCHWMERIHFGKEGFWWKHGSKSMATHQQPVWWDVGDELWRVDVNAVPHYASYDGYSVVETIRVLGKVRTRIPTPRTADPVQGELLPTTEAAKHHGWVI